MERHFEGKVEAGLYKRYRPSTPQIMVDRVMNYVREKHTGPLSFMVDVGCGNGQNTLVYAPYFQKVMGTDISPNMIAEVENEPSNPANVSFVVSPAEKLPVPDGSLDLVTGSQCFHWFDHDQFNLEMERVLKPNGVVAMIGHDPEVLADPDDEKKTEELGDVIVEFLASLLPVMRAASNSVLTHYVTLPFPYEDVVKEANIRYDTPVVLADYVGVLETFSPYQKLVREQPELASAARDKLVKRLTKILEVDDGTPLEDVHTTMRLENFLVIGRKKKTMK